MGEENAKAGQKAVQGPGPAEDSVSKDFFELLADKAVARDDDKYALIQSIIDNAKDGDNASLNMIKQALSESRYGKDEKLKLTNEQYRQIIRLAARRIDGTI